LAPQFSVGIPSLPKIGVADGEIRVDRFGKFIFLWDKCLFPAINELIVPKFFVPLRH
jgi:hypothetical protein